MFLSSWYNPDNIKTNLFCLIHFPLHPVTMGSEDTCNGKHNI